MFHVNRIDHVAVTVRNLERSREWYARVLGLDLSRKWDPHPWMIGRGGTNIALFQAPDAKPIDNLWGHLAFQHLAFNVDAKDFEAAQQHLRELGIAYEGPVDHDVAFSIYFPDPDGHRLEITCYPESRK